MEPFSQQLDARSVWVGNVPATMHEVQAMDWMRSLGRQVPTRVLIRASTGKEHGYFAIMYFESAEVAEGFRRRGRIVWADGTFSELRPCAPCVYVWAGEGGGGGNQKTRQH